MAGRFSEHIRSNVVGYIALFCFATSGAAYATHPGGVNTISSEDIINDEVRSADINNGDGVRSIDVRNDTEIAGGLAAEDLRPGSVGSSEVAGDAIGSAQVAPDSLGAQDLAPDSVGGSEVAIDAIGAAEVAPDSLGQQDLGVASVTSSEVGTDAIGSAEIATGAVGSPEIVDQGVGNADLADNSVTGSKVFPSSLTGADILSNSLSSSDIGTDAVGSSEIGPNAVGSSEVANGSLGTAEFAGSIPAARVTRTVNQGILNDDETALNFNSERYDTAGMHSNSANLSRLTAPVDGIYMVTAQVQWDVNGFGPRTLAIRRNGTVALARDRRVPGTDSVNAPAVNLTTVARLAAGDFVEAEVFQESGGNLSVLRVGEESPEFTMTWLAPGP